MPTINHLHLSPVADPGDVGPNNGTPPAKGRLTPGLVSVMIIGVLGLAGIIAVAKWYKTGRSVKSGTRGSPLPGAGPRLHPVSSGLRANNTRRSADPADEIKLSRHTSCSSERTLATYPVPRYANPAHSGAHPAHDSLGQSPPAYDDDRSVVTLPPAAYLGSLRGHAQDMSSDKPFRPMIPGES
ncbi:hypothetical protein PUNSTDRAFT_123460 [Punctularia strigosozonata HHB-11173 SS5]|uniref:uncharacterized protein n=1 Tax=Punctularia strigosozonata (strain HHB-11173) TaxID=741275 RepID=UPI00044185FF|nr:uncharacterized protein PUNSTDRAFT_123460 [Punctularia strigosozonata HHB-11173 SS5]EIN13418.1 hypothetical protein PUNSTDRAFT_123460 [Punctularia strigosozonata HHB-11173 SS5]